MRSRGTAAALALALFAGCGGDDDGGGDGGGSAMKTGERVSACLRQAGFEPNDRGPELRDRGATFYGTDVIYRIDSERGVANVYVGDDEADAEDIRLQADAGERQRREILKDTPDAVKLESELVESVVYEFDTELPETDREKMRACARS